MKILQYEKEQKPLTDTSHIADAMRKNRIKKIVLTSDDIGRALEWGWGMVLPADVGKICVISDGLFYMENSEQLNKRLAKGA